MFATDAVHRAATSTMPPPPVTPLATRLVQLVGAAVAVVVLI